MQQWTRIKEAEAESDLSLALVVDAELFRLDAVIRWLDAADGRIKRAAPGSPGEPGAAALPRVPRRRGTGIARRAEARPGERYRPSGGCPQGRVAVRLALCDPNP
ncbi:MAG TPA: hypothetical protein VK280_00180 [Streptosporangiaceae bacterium]|nr:hypothetical protein [Streptosporangiaceae bacterium]